MKLFICLSVVILSVGCSATAITAVEREQPLRILAYLHWIESASGDGMFLVHDRSDIVAALRSRTNAVVRQFRGRRTNNDTLLSLKLEELAEDRAFGILSCSSSPVSLVVAHIEFRRVADHWKIVSCEVDGVARVPNQALQPTRMLVTFRADARPAPSTRVADL